MGTIYPGVKCPPPPQSSCMLSFLCKGQMDWEERGHLKFLNSLREDARNNFSYLVPMNIVNGGRGIYPGVKCQPPPPQPSCILSFLCNDQRDLEEPGHLKFLIALQEDAGNNFCLVPKKSQRAGGGAIYPRGKVFPLSTLMYAFIFM